MTLAVKITKCSLYKFKKQNSFQLLALLAVGEPRVIHLLIV